MQLAMISLTFLTVLAWIEFAFYASQHKEIDDPQYALAMRSTTSAETRAQILQTLHERHKRQQRASLVFALGVTVLALPRHISIASQCSHPALTRKRTVAPELRRARVRT